MGTILPAPGYYPGVPDTDYRAWQAINITTLKHIKRSPLHLRYAMEHPKDPSPQMVMGSALHAAVFEPQKFAANFVTIPTFDRRTKAGREAYDDAVFAAAGKQVVNTDDMETVAAMAEAVRGCSAAMRWIDRLGDSEASILWKDETTGTLCKGRLDRLARGGISGDLPVIIELKSTRDASFSGFARELATYHYAAQAAWYAWGYQKATGQKPAHFFVAVENEPPHAVACYTLGDQSLQTGEMEMRVWLDRYAACCTSNRWPGYPDSVVDIELPNWAQEVPNE